MSRHVFISAGEVSGDIAGALLAREIRRKDPGVVLHGIGGSRMADAGVELDVIGDHLGAVGITEALSALPAVPRIWWRIRRSVRRRRPDVAVLIGNDVFNVCLARWLGTQGIRRVAFFPPQVWVWRSLARPLAASFDTILTSFPDEQSIYRRASRGHVTFVGHHLADLLEPVTVEAREDARRAIAAGGLEHVVGLFPGSRWHELRGLLPLMLDAAKDLAACRPSIRFVLPVAAAQHRRFVEQQIDQRGLSTLVSLADESRRVMEAADLLLLASGTATLEAALMGVPAIVTYKVSHPTHAFLRSCIRLGLIESYRVALPNLVLGRVVMPELLQSDATAASLAREAEALLAHPERRRQLQASLAEVRRYLFAGDGPGTPGAIERAADAILALPHGAHAGSPAPAAARGAAWGKALE
jgi:lipid-A-disaccharide synthase